MPQSASSFAHAIRALVACIGIALGIPCGASDTARIEVYPIQTLDVPTAAMLHGGPLADAPARTIAGELRLPTTSSTKMPAVIFLHGDAGAVADQPPWIDELVASGIAVFTVDSFSGRGLVSSSPLLGSFGGALPSAATRIVDAYRALDILAAHPRIDASRIALMGVSSGGRTTILAATKRFSGAVARNDTRFAAYVALYPPCNAHLVDDERLEAGPVRIYIGGADNITRADACERFVTRLKKAGVNADVTVYAGAYHGFDNPPGAESVDDRDEPGFSACSFIERDDRLVNVDTGLPPTLQDRCVTKGITAGRDATADAATRAAVRKFFATILRPDR